MELEKFTKRLINISTEILEIGNDIRGKRKKPKALDKPLANLEKLLSDRFNLKYKVVPSYSILLATMPPINTTDTGLESRNMKELVIGYGDKDFKKFVQKNDKILKEDGGFYIDYKNKRIEYKGKNKFNSEVYINPMELANTGISGEELASMLLHEIGHGFEYIRYQLYLGQKTQGLLDDITAVLFEDNALDKVVEVTIKHTGKKLNVKELSYTDKINVIMDIPRDVFNYSKDEFFNRLALSNQGASGKENEMMADKFVTGFGLNHFLTSGLNKLTLFYNTSEKMTVNLHLEMSRRLGIAMFDYIKDPFFHGVVTTLISSLITFLIIRPLMQNIYASLDIKQRRVLDKLIAVITNYVLLFNHMKLLVDVICYTTYTSTLLKVALIGVGLVKNYYFNYSEDMGETLFGYEHEVNRVDSIKRNIIGQLKKEKDTERKKYFLDQLAYVDKELLTTKQTLSNVDTFGTIFPYLPVIDLFKDGNSINPIYVLASKVKEQMNNDLYVSSAKLDLHNG